MNMPTDLAHGERLQRILQVAESGSLSTIRDLALELDLSPSHLQHLFKQGTGTRLGHWLTERRLQRAANLLAETKMSVKEIAYAVGYKHPSSFVRAFERCFRKAPRQFQQEMLTKRRFG
jgi:two-component system response regulator YesN